MMGWRMGSYPYRKRRRMLPGFADRPLQFSITSRKPYLLARKRRWRFLRPMIARRFRAQFRRGSTIRPQSNRIASRFDLGNLLPLLQSCVEACHSAQIHGLMLKVGLDSIAFPVSKLLAQICKQDMDYAASLFNQIENKNLFMFNSMLRGFSICSDPRKCLVLFNCARAGMHIHELVLDQFTFASVLKSCSRLQEVGAGRGIHALALKSGSDLFLNVKNALMHFYFVSCGVQEAHQVFDELGERRDLVSWNSLMRGYLSMGEYGTVIDLFKKLQVDSCSPSVVTILGVLQASGETRSLLLGESVHVLCLKSGLLCNLNVVTALISMYGKQSHICCARRIFDETDIAKDVIVWNSLIDAYAKTGLVQEALELLKLMKHSGVKPSSSTLASFLCSCSSSAGGLILGQSSLALFDETPLVLDTVLGTAILDMYAKSGLLEEAITVFNRMQSKDVKTWTAMISVYGLHGQPEEAINLFNQMEREGYTPNEATFLAVLNSCSHGVLVAEGTRFFRRMVDVYKVIPRSEHYGCLTDLMGRAGMLEDAYEVIKELPILEKDSAAWRSLLGACRVYGNVSLAGRVIQVLEKIDGGHPADQLALVAICAAAGNQHPILLVQDFDHHQSAKKEPGSSMYYTTQLA